MQVRIKQYKAHRPGAAQEVPRTSRACCRFRPIHSTANSNTIITTGSSTACRLGKLGTEKSVSEKIRLKIIPACAMLSDLKNTQAKVVSRKVKPMFKTLLR